MRSTPTTPHERPLRHATTFAAIVCAALPLLVHGQVAGQLDTSFSSDGKTTVHFDLGGSGSDIANDVLVQPDGKIVMVGSVETAPGNSDWGVVRLNQDGSEDSGFGTNGRSVVTWDYGGLLDDDPYAVVAVSDALVIAGSVSRGSAGGFDADFALARLTSTGALDTAGFDADGRVEIPFDVGGDLRDVALDLAVMDDGRIVVVGWVNTGTAGDSDIGVARIQSGGALDSTFDGDGKAVLSLNLGGDGSDVATAVAIQPDGKIVIVGDTDYLANNTDFVVVRLETDGSYDSTFNGTGVLPIGFDLGGSNYDTASAVAIQDDGKILVVGSASKESGFVGDFAVARVLEDGSLDPSFGGGSGKATIAFDLDPSYQHDFASGLALQSDGAVVLAGKVDRASGYDDMAFVRLSFSGQLDLSFGSGGSTIVAFDLGQDNTDSCTGVALQADGSIVGVGYADRSGAGDQDFAVVRLTNDLVFADRFESGDTGSWSSVAAR
jgi:uncharacterized delta-60 repeat protein